MAETTSKTTKKPAAKKPPVKAANPVTSVPKATKVPAVKKAAKPVAEKAAPVTKKQVAPKAAPAKKTASPAKTVKQENPKVMVVSDEQRYRMVAEAAYYRAESNQFRSDPLRDWIEAEKDIAALLSGNK